MSASRSSPAGQSQSLLPVVAAADNLTSKSAHAEQYTPFHLTLSDHLAQLPPLGLLLSAVVTELQSDPRDDSTCPWQFCSTARPDADDDMHLEVQCVFFADWVVEGGQAEMARVMKETVEQWRDDGKFAEPLSGE